MRIGVFGHYGNGNLGDEAITEATIASARRLLGADDVCLYSIVPADSAFRHGLDAYPIRRGSAPVLAAAASAGASGNVQTARATSVAETVPTENSLRNLLKRSKLIRSCANIARATIALPGRMAGECLFLWQSWQSLRGLDLMIVAGSNQYLDNFGGIMGFPYTLLKWAVLCRLRGAKVVYLSIGAGPIDSRISRTMVRLAIRLGQYHSYRDEASLQLIEGPDARMNGVVYPDLACNLDYEETDIDYDSTSPVVAINPMPVYGDYWFVQDEAKYRGYLTKLAELIVHADQRGSRVLLFPTQTRDMDAIIDLVGILKGLSSSAAEKVQIADADTSQDVMRIIQSAHIIVPTRFHGAVLGILAKRLVLGVCYQAKAVAVLEAAGQRPFAFMLDDMKVTDLTDAFDRLWRDRQTALKSIRSRSTEVRAAIDEQYRLVLGLLA